MEEPSDDEQQREGNGTEDSGDGDYTDEEGEMSEEGQECLGELSGAGSSTGNSPVSLLRRVSSGMGTVRGVRASVCKYM